MINKLITFTILYVCMTISYAQTQNLTLWDSQPGGLNTHEPSHTLAKTDFLDINNVYTDGGLFANMREGLQTVWNSSAAPQNIYEYINLAGNRYLIVKSSQYLGYVDTDNTYKVLMATLPASARLWKVQYLNDCYLGTNQITDRWLFDPTASTKLTISTFMPCGKYFVESYDRVFAINISTPSKNAPAITLNNDKSIVRYCEIGNLMSWDGTSGDQWIGISRNDGEDLTGGFKFKGNVYVAKAHSVHQLLNVDDNDVTNDGSICVMPNIGILGMDTIQEINGNMYWLSADGVVEWTGTSYDIISNDIQDEIDTLKDRNLGNANNHTDTTAGDFGEGQGVNIDTTTTSGSVTIPGQYIYNGYGGFDYSITYSSQSFFSLTNITTNKVSIYFGTDLDVIPEIEVNTSEFGIKTAAGVIVSSINFNSLSAYNANSWVEFTLPSDFPVLANTTYYLYLRQTGNIPYKVGYSTGNTYQYGRGFMTSTSDWAFKFGFYRYAQYQSPVIDLDSNWLQWGKFETGHSAPAGTSIKWYVSVATASVLCSSTSLTAVTTGVVIPSSSGGYILYFASMTTTDIGVTPQINDVTINYLETITSTEELINSYSDLKNMRYGIAGTKELGSSHNDIIYNFQIKNRKWTKFDIPARSFGKYNNEQYLGDSTGNGNINRFSYDVNTDNGSKIKTMIKTPDYVLSTRANDCRFEELWTYAEPSVVYSSMTIQYYLNKNTVGFSTNTANVSLTATSGYEDMFIKTRMKAPIDRFRTLSFKVENFERLFGLDFLFSYQPIGTR